MALLVIAIGVVSIMGLFPLSMRVHNEAMDENQVTAMADEVVQLAMLKVKDGGDFPSKSAVLDNPDLDHLTFQNPDNPSETWWFESMNTSGYSYYTISQDGVSNDVFLNTGLLRIHRTHDAQRDGSTVKVTDMDVVFAVWQETVPFIGIDEDGNVTERLGIEIDDVKVIRLTIEASWPASIDYVNRKKLTFVTEVNP